MSNDNEVSGPVAARVAHEIRRMRLIRGMTLQSVSEQLRILGYPLATSILSKIETEARRITVDDLVNIARALGVPSEDLLHGPQEARKERTPTIAPSDSLRLAALDRALQARGHQEPPSVTTQRALCFYDFLKGNTDNAYERHP